MAGMDDDNNILPQPRPSHPSICNNDTSYIWDMTNNNYRCTELTPSLCGDTNCKRQEFKCGGGIISICEYEMTKLRIELFVESMKIMHWD